MFLLEVTFPLSGTQYARLAPNARKPKGSYARLAPNVRKAGVGEGG